MRKRAAWGLAALLAGGPAWAGTLGDFEREATREREAEPAKADAGEESGGFFSDLFLDLFLEVFAAGGAYSAERTAGQGSEPRGRGEAAIPFARVDAAWQDLRSDVRAADLRAEAGYGPLAVEARSTRYTERDPRDRLTLSRVHALWRMSFTRFVEVDAGIGSMFLNGDSSASGSSLTTPVHIFPLPSVGIEFRPAWGWVGGGPVNDYDLSVALLRRGWSLRAGFRWVRSGEAHLDGPIAGAAFHF